MNESDSKLNYRHAGFPLIPAIIQELVLELFAGQTVERQTIVQVVPRVHAERGGAPNRSANLTFSVKKALANLRQAGLADNPAYGFWRIKLGDGLAEAPSNVVSVSPPQEESRIADVELGHGGSCVYLYYFPAYKEQAARAGKDVWPCKIGVSNGDPIDRIYSQGVTALPEEPLVAMIFRTPLASQWERLLHLTLAVRGQSIDDAPGAEWFNTSVAEVIEIIRFIDPQLDTTTLRQAAVPTVG